MVGIVLLGIFVVLLIFGAPIALCLGMSSVGAILTQGAGKPLDAIMSVLPRLCSSASSKFVLLAIPFFILSGNVMEKAGISGRLINLAEKCLGHIRGGMAMVCVVVSCFFAAISGSGPATVAALGLIMIPALVKAGYPAAFSCALMAAGGAIGVVDLLIVFVHYQYLETAVRNALPMIDRHTMILCLQNGLGNYDEIAKVVPEEQIIIGNTAFGSTPIEPAGDEKRLCRRQSLRP